MSAVHRFSRVPIAICKVTFALRAFPDSAKIRKSLVAALEIYATAEPTEKWQC
jgi:hypothetical protein